MSFKIPSRVVFVGNIPYDLSEEQIIEIFNSAGKVINFRLVYDRETGRPKGFGFAEYPDSDSASSAVRNLHNYEIKGRRLRVDFSNEGGTEDEDGESMSFGGMNAGLGPATTTSGGPGTTPTGSASAPNTSSSLPPLPAGKELPPGVTCADQISRTLSTLPAPQLLDILSQVKLLATNEPNRAVELFEAAPQLAYSIFQALLLMNLVSPDNIYSVVDMNSLAAAAVAGPPAQQPGVAPSQVQLPSAGSVPPSMGSGYPNNGYGAPPVAAPPQMPIPTAPAAYNRQQQQQQQQPYSAAVVPPPPPPAPSAPVGGQDSGALMRAVMDLPQETIDALPETERMQILALRASYQAQSR
ncbi:RNA recognition domain-containing protein [Ceratocystis lukuohia]|uniref:RNA recognition domain-containing protein n=1 Tax=Ceratocystis lukuohia TaxID=2019550 RepID=A0ABR4MAU0_9PEZI